MKNDLVGTYALIRNYVLLTAFLFVKLMILILQVRESTEALEGAEKGKSSQAHVFLIDGAPLVVISSKKW